jgi:hypothetical protein
MMIEVCHPKSTHELEFYKISDLCFCPNFASAQLATSAAIIDLISFGASTGLPTTAQGCTCTDQYTSNTGTAHANRLVPSW